MVSLYDLMARAVDKISQGKQVAGTGSRVPLMYFADDGKYMADDVQTLQRMYEASWLAQKLRFWQWTEAPLTRPGATPPPLQSYFGPIARSPSPPTLLVPEGG